MIEEKLSSKTMSPIFVILCALAKVIVTDVEPLVVLNALVNVVVVFIG